MTLARTTTRPARALIGAGFWGAMVFLYAPILMLVLLSFNTGPVPRLPMDGLGTGAYRAALSDAMLWQTVRLSLWIAVLSAALATAIALPAAFAIIRRRGVFRALVAGCALAPLVMPAVVIGAAQLLAFVWVGLPRSALAVVFGHSVMALPYATLILLPAIARLDARRDEAAADLGASRGVALLTVTLPPALPAIAAAFLVCLTLSFDEVAIARFLIGAENTFPIYLLAQLRLPQNLPQAMAVAVLAAAGSVLLFLVIDRLQRSERAPRR
jgi:spermidine/putrescine transport system permease protein